MQVNYICLQHPEGDVTASDSIIVSCVAHDPEVSLRFGLSSTGKIWSWLGLADLGCVHSCISGQLAVWLGCLDYDEFSLGAQVTVIHVMLVWAHSPTARVPRTRAKARKASGSELAQYHVVRGHLETSSERRKRLCFLMEGATMSPCQGTDARKAWPVFQSTMLGSGFWAASVWTVPIACIRAPAGRCSRCYWKCSVSQ